MKYLLFSERSWEELMTIVESDSVLQAEREKFPEKYPRELFAPGLLVGELPKLTGYVRTVFVYDDASPEQIANVTAYWAAQIVGKGLKTYKRWLMPLLDTTELSEKFREHEKMREQSKTTR